MNKQLLKQLAQATYTDGIINEKVSEFAIAELSNKDLKRYEFYLKQILKQNTVRITSAIELDNDTKTELEKKIIGKNFFYAVDQKLGGGIVIENNDNILDASVKGMIHQVVKNVEEQL